MRRPIEKCPVGDGSKVTIGNFEMLRASIAGDYDIFQKPMPTKRTVDDY